MNKAFKRHANYYLSFILCLAFSVASNITLAGKSETSPQWQFNSKGATLHLNRDYTLNFGGQFHYDVLRSRKKHFGNDADIRRARVVATFEQKGTWKMKLGYDISPDRHGWRNAWVQSNIIDDTNIRIGQFITPFSMEAMQASKDITFIERSLPQAMAPGFRLGMQLKQQVKSAGLTAAIMANPIKNSSSFDDGISFVFRGVTQPIRKRRNLIHLGMAIEHRELDSGAFTRISSNHEKSLLNKRHIRSDRFRHADSYTNFNLELAQSKKRFLWQSQLIARLTRSDTSQSRKPRHLLSYGASGQVSWLSKRAKRKYSRTSGTFGSVQPKKNKKDVFELSARLSYLALDSGDVVESETGITLGAAWLFNKNLKLSTNLSFNDLDGERQREQFSAFALQSRLQLNF